jgi:hypothetical protein
MQIDPTEEQVLLALWTSLTSNSMMEGRDRRQVKCSPELKNLLPARAIQVEYNVTNTSSLVTTR